MNIKAIEKKYRGEIKAFGKHVRVVRRKFWMSGKSNWAVTFVVGVQTFVIGRDQYTKAEAKWLRAMLCVALANLRKEML